MSSSFSFNLPDPPWQAWLTSTDRKYSLSQSPKTYSHTFHYYQDAIRLHSIMELKENMAGKEKLKEMAHCDLRTPQDYVSQSVEEAKMAFRLQTRLLDCRTNIPTKYRRDLICRACRPDPSKELYSPILPQDGKWRKQGSALWRGGIQSIKCPHVLIYIF